MNRLLKQILPRVFAVSPMSFIAIGVLFALNGSIAALSVKMLQIFLDQITEFTTGRSNLKAVILVLVLFFGIKLLSQAISGLANFLGETYDPRVVGRLTFEAHQKIAELEIINFEDAEKLDVINKGYQGIQYTVNLINTLVDVLTYYLPYFILMGFYLYSLKPMLILVLLLAFIPVILTRQIQAKKYSQLEDASSPIRRRCEHYEKCLTDRVFFKETRTLGASSYFLNLYKDALISLSTLKWKTDSKAIWLDCGAKVLTLIGYFSILGMIFGALMEGSISIGAFAAVFASIDTLFGTMDEVINGRLGYYAQNFGKISNYLTLLELPGRTGEDLLPKVSKGRAIDLKDVCFSYPGTSNHILQGINLTIESGETIVVVGANGAGKSTLIRLLTGLYLPLEGTVRHNGIQVNKIKAKELYESTAVVFQNFQCYKLTLADNISFGDSARNNESTFPISSPCFSNEMSDHHINWTLLEAGIPMDINLFPDKFETVLSKEFNGIDLSGGQWQRIAIARGLYKKHDLMVMDEPTSSIDPLEESRIYERFEALAKGKTAVIVTHRLGCVKFADRIVVLHEGQIDAVGTHQALMNDCPRYKTMWNSQVEHYEMAVL